MKKTYTRVHLSLKLRLRVRAPDAEALRDAVLVAALLAVAACIGPAALWLAMSP